MRKIVIVIFLTVSFSVKAQDFPIDIESRSYSILIDRLSSCEEGGGENDCDGQEYHLFFHFNEKNVIVEQHNLTTCGEVLSISQLGKFGWSWSKNKLWCIVFNKQEVSQTFLEGLIIVLDSKKLIGRKLNKNYRKVSEYHFCES